MPTAYKPNSTVARKDRDSQNLNITFKNV